MVRINLLKGLIKENGETLEDFSKVIKKSVTTVQERLKGKKTFSADEIYLIRNHYNLSNERLVEIFFADELTST